MKHNNNQNSHLKRLTQGAFLLLVFILGWWHKNQPLESKTLIQAISEQQNDVMVEFEAKVTKILTDDTEGIKHQKFIVQHQAHTILIAHNTDLAPRVPIKINDGISIRGEYEWNQQGGVVHWTHHDPSNRREGGWIIHNEKKFK